jgi:hypothetical protein
VADDPEGEDDMREVWKLVDFIGFLLVVGLCGFMFVAGMAAGWQLLEGLLP